jgi:glycosyltransferase involved in cell wall biosynthesis
MSEFLREQLAMRGYPGRVLPAPIDGQVDQVSSPGRRWLYVARATPLKGGDRFIRLVNAADADGVVVGDGPELASWRRLAASLGARVEFLGALPHEQVLAEMDRADRLLLLPRADGDGTGAEGLGLVLLEAHARGISVVGCRTGGVPEAVGPGLILADPDDIEGSIKAIAAHRSDGRAWMAQHHGAMRTAACLAESPPTADNAD